MYPPQPTILHLIKFSQVYLFTNETKMISEERAWDEMKHVMSKGNKGRKIEEWMFILCHFKWICILSNYTKCVKYFMLCIHDSWKLAIVSKAVGNPIICSTFAFTVYTLLDIVSRQNKVRMCFNTHFRTPLTLITGGLTPLEKWPLYLFPLWVVFFPTRVSNYLQM